MQIRKTYEVTEVYEVSVDDEKMGYNYLVIYGHHINGWFVAIPNWEKSAEITLPDKFSTGYNAEKIAKAFDGNDYVGNLIASAIIEHYKTVKE